MTTDGDSFRRHSQDRERNRRRSQDRERNTGAVTQAPRPAIPCVGAIVFDPDGRLLLVQRGHEPSAGLWSLPGGRVEPGETDEQAVIREVAEETGLTVRPGRLAGAVRRPGPGGVVFDIRDYQADVTGGAIAAGDDAADVRWAAPADLATLSLIDGLLDALTDWGVLP